MSVNMFLFCKLIHLYQFSDSTYKWYDMVSYHLSFSFWLTSFKWQSLDLSILLQMALYHAFYSWVMLLFSHSVGSDSFWPHGLQHNRLPCPSPSPGACSNSCSFILWCHPTISSYIVPFSSWLQSFPASGSFPMSQFFILHGQIIRGSASASILPKTIQDWFPLGWTGWISLQSKGLSRVFSSTTVRKHQFCGTQPLLWSNSHPYMTNGKP